MKYHSAMKGLFSLLPVWFSVFTAVNLLSQTPIATSFHGTVNVLMVNPNGIVVVTDSRLSSGNETSPYEGQKLIKVSDAKYVTIAGQFSNPGVDFGNNTFLAAQIVPTIINRFIGVSPTLSEQPIEDIANTLAGATQFSLGLAARMDEMSNRTVSTMGTEISVAGYENGVSRIVQKTIIPDGMGHFTIKTTCVADGSKELQFCLGGIKEIARTIIMGGGPTRDPVLINWRNASRLNHGATFSIDKMRALALRAEEVTSTQAPVYVGGTREIAVISKGSTVEFDNTIANPLPTKMNDFNFIERSYDHYGDAVENERRLQGSHFGFTLGHDANDREALFYADSGVKNAVVLLDHTMFVSSTFENCVLVYYGSPLTYFDKSNRLVNTTKLFIGPKARETDSFVLQMKAAFPKLEVVPRDGPILLGGDGKGLPPDPW